MVQRMALTTGSAKPAWRSARRASLEDGAVRGCGDRVCEGDFDCVFLGFDEVFSALDAETEDFIEAGGGRDKCNGLGLRPRGAGSGWRSHCSSLSIKSGPDPTVRWKASEGSCLEEMLVCESDPMRHIERCAIPHNPS
jgi:hypothetical protein